MNTNGITVFQLNYFCSTCHKAMADDALVASKMHVKSGGVQPLMRDTVYRGVPQSMVDANGEPKGLRQVLSKKNICILIRLII